MKTNPNMIRTLKAGTFYPTLFTNTALNTDKNEPWWEGMDDPKPAKLQDWKGRIVAADSRAPAAHPNSRFTVAIRQCPTLSPEFENPRGVPLSAILFGSRRSRLLPLVLESFGWEQGVLMASIMGAETTPAATLQVGQLRRDPMAMLPFCGYNMADYFGHWLNMGKRISRPPKIFFVNWFRTDDSGKFIWPGFGQNIRVLKWIVERTEAAGPRGAKETPIGLVPGQEDLDLSGLEIPPTDLEQLSAVHRDEWRAELIAAKQFLESFGSRLPEQIRDEFRKISTRL